MQHRDEPAWYLGCVFLKTEFNTFALRSIIRCPGGVE